MPETTCQLEDTLTGSCELHPNSSGQTDSPAIPARIGGRALVSAHPEGGGTVSSSSTEKHSMKAETYG